MSDAEPVQTKGVQWEACQCGKLGKVLFKGKIYCLECFGKAK